MYPSCPYSISGHAPTSGMSPWTTAKEGGEVLMYAIASSPITMVSIASRSAPRTGASLPRCGAEPVSHASPASCAPARPAAPQNASAAIPTVCIRINILHSSKSLMGHADALAGSTAKPPLPSRLAPSDVTPWPSRLATAPAESAARARAGATLWLSAMIGPFRPAPVGVHMQPPRLRRAGARTCSDRAPMRTPAFPGRGPHV